jgi:hypothetical protein
MPLAAPGLETPEGGFHELRTSRKAWEENWCAEQLLDVAAKVELGAGQPDNSVEPCLHFGWQVAPRHQSLRLRADRIERLHEVSLLQFTGIVGHSTKGLGGAALGI